MIVTATQEHLVHLVRMAQILSPRLSQSVLTVEMAEFLQAEKKCVFAELDSQGTPVGFAQCSVRTEPVAGCTHTPVLYIDGLYVKPSERRRGIARRLLDACEAWGREKGCAELAAVCEQDKAAGQAAASAMGLDSVLEAVCLAKRL